MLNAMSVAVRDYALVTALGKYAGTKDKLLWQDEVLYAIIGAVMLACYKWYKKNGGEEEPPSATWLNSRVTK